MAALRVSFLGAGNMAQALAKGFIASGLTQPGNLVASCPPTDKHLLRQMEHMGLPHDTRQQGGSLPWRSPCPPESCDASHAQYPGSSAAGGRQCLPGARTLLSADAQLTHRMLSAVGEVSEVPESYMDAVTGLSGAGPAYVYMVVEALADGGVRMGLPRPFGSLIGITDINGFSQDGEGRQANTPGLLKDEVCSPGGCTIRGCTGVGGVVV
ncbi:hypothetical protein Pcinc_017790 [Petrolisthes cinctipes]|uniref:Pyrroline-5-carboxylate reductase n=1 Tax=Petrolisthes cinctipes TaxID=88211 RepID=A0AAE1FTI6_PETCI|nr:hypothetical protein Pcinc_017790 [Petrolisthes cinctipes]